MTSRRPGPLPHAIKIFVVATSADGDSPESGDQAMCYLSIPAQLTHDCASNRVLMSQSLRLASSVLQVARNRMVQPPCV